MASAKDTRRDERRRYRLDAARYARRTRTTFFAGGIEGALEDGVMRMEGAALTAEQRIALAEYLTGRRFENTGLPEEAFCASPGPTLDAARIS